MRASLAILVALTSLSPSAHADYRMGRQVLLEMAGCFLVDYSFTEVESLLAGYNLDPRVYDASAQVAVKELILATEDATKKHIRLQHVLFSSKLDGSLSFVMKHQAEDWDYEAPFHYEFMGDGRWEPRRLATGGADAGKWVRRVTNLDDGLRYQCAAPWTFAGEYPEWTCDNYAPIPGRETRDMRRRDYQTLSRSTRLLSFPGSWLERQNNVKTIHQNGVRTPMAREVGKTWYVRQPNTACAAALSWAMERESFWTLLEGVWNEFLIGDAPWTERATLNGMPRYMSIGDVEDRFYNRVNRDAAAADAARAELRTIINSYRLPN